MPTPQAVTIPLRVKSSIRREPPAAGEGLRIALYQGEGPVGSRAAVEANLARLEEVAPFARWYGAHLVVFPEKFPSGYAITVRQLKEEGLAEAVDGPMLERVRSAARAHGIAVVLPYAEVAAGPGGKRYYDSIAAVGPDGALRANSRKTHLYGAAERRNYSFGDELPPVVAVNGFPVGILNCYECEFPELYRHLAGKGARLIVGPTAADGHFPLADGRPTQVAYPDATEHVIPALAAIYRVFVAYCNRRGWERVPEVGCWQYQGNSGIWAPNGRAVLAAGPEDRASDTLLVADCLPAEHLPFSPEGNHLTDCRLPPGEALRPGK
jgi:5-aminopentanamidase